MKHDGKVKIVTRKGSPPPAPKSEIGATDESMFLHQGRDWHYEFVLTDAAREGLTGLPKVVFEPRQRALADVPDWVQKKLDSAKKEQDLTLVLRALEKRLVSKKSAIYYFQAARIIAAITRTREGQEAVNSWLTQDLVTTVTSRIEQRDR